MTLIQEIVAETAPKVRVAVRVELKSKVVDGILEEMVGPVKEAFMKQVEITEVASLIVSENIHEIEKEVKNLVVSYLDEDDHRHMVRDALRPIILEIIRSELEG